MLQTLRETLDQMNIWSVKTLTAKYSNEKYILSQQEHSADDAKTYSSPEQLMEAVDQERPERRSSRLGLDLDAILAQIDERIAQLEKEEALQQNPTATEETTDPPEKLSKIWSTNLPAWAKDYFPEAEFRLSYSCGYLKILIDHWIRLPDDQLLPKSLPPVPDWRLTALGTIMLSLINAAHRGDEQHVFSDVRRIKSSLRNHVISIMKKETFSQEDVSFLAFSRDILQLFLSVDKYSRHRTTDQHQLEARAYLDYYLANGLYIHAPDDPRGLDFAKKGIALCDPADRQDAFNVLGLSALKTAGNKQLAYDTYCSWIEQKPMGKLEEFWPLGFAFGNEEALWRKEGKSSDPVATIYNNFAYVCDAIAGTYDRGTKERKTFQKLAVQHINTALERDPDTRYYRSCGLMLAEMITPDKTSLESIQQYEKALDTAATLRDKLPAMRLYCEGHVDELLSRLISNKQKLGFSQWAQQEGLPLYHKLKDYFALYHEMLEKSKSDPTVDEDDKRELRNAFFEVQKQLGGKNSTLELALLLIQQLAGTLMTYLRRNSYSKYHYFTRNPKKDAQTPTMRSSDRDIAYYTTLKTALYLFNVVYRKDKSSAPAPVEKKDSPEYEKGINCLTMMQAYYMNDPYEGLTFGNGLNGKNPYDNILFYRGDTWRFREDIFQNNFVFLKSFTDRMDNLLMWNRYGSDRETGSRDSNGCCIRFASDCFDRVTDANVSEDKRLLDKGDDYGLYRVVYLSKDGKLDTKKNPGLNSTAKRCYSHLKQLLEYVNEELGMLREDDVRIHAVRSFVQEVLNPVIFLFKDDDYADEAEYRLVISRNHDELDKIRMLPGSPEKACVNPYFQVCIDKVILGPNVEKPEHWFNHFRYHIAAMWRRALGPGKPIPEFTVEKSNIHYHT